MDMSAAEVWWRYVPSSRIMVKSAANDLTDNGLSVQILPNFFPWKDQFELELRECIDKYGSGIALRELNGNDLSQYTYLLDGIVHSLEIDNGFDGSLRSIGSNLPDEGCVIWLHDLSKAQQAQCFDLSLKAAAVSGKGEFPRFVFVFESSLSGRHKGVKRIESGDVCRSNIRYFAYRMLMEADLDQQIEYAVALVMELASAGTEHIGNLCEKIVRNGFEKEYQAIENDEKLLYSIHRAQIRSIEPLIQLGRLQLCQKYHAEIQKILPFDDDYSTTVSDPCELELRHLWYRKSDIGFSKSDSELLKKLYDARNDLSHQRILAYPLISSLIDMYS